MNFALTRKLIIFGVALPLAVLMGFTLATPQDTKTFLLMVAVTGVLILPIMLKWYHPVLIFCWNASVNIFFLPGKPQLWMFLSVIGLGIAILNNALDRERRFYHVPALTIPLLFFLAVVLVTANLTGGIGIRALGGSTIGGKGYFSIMFAVMGFFAITSMAVPLERAKTYVAGYFLSTLTATMSNFAYMLGPAFYFLYFLFPVDLAMNQAFADFSVGQVMRRLNGLAVAGAGAFCFVMARYGIRGILDVRRPWQMGLFLAANAISLLGGFRSLLLTYIIYFSVQFCLEGLVRTRLFLIVLLAGALGGAAALPFVEHMPLAVQRCLAFVPGLNVSQEAKMDADASTAWRVEMWRVLVPQIPKYLIVGKGYALNPSDLYLAQQAQMRGLAKSYEVALVGGAYHNGPLSVIIPFGIFGVIGFLWLLAAGLWVLYRNYRYGHERLKKINTFLFTYFITRIIVFFFIFGGIDGELYIFLGALGLSISLNRGVSKPAAVEAQPAALQLQPA